MIKTVIYNLQLLAFKLLMEVGTLGCCEIINLLAASGAYYLLHCLLLLTITT